MTFHPETTGSGSSLSEFNLQDKANILEWIDWFEVSDDPFEMSEVIMGVSRLEFPDTLFRHWYNTPRRTKSGEYLTRVTAALSARRKVSPLRRDD